MNSIIALKPYLKHGTWVFDDPNVGLVAEPFVCGIPEMINSVVEKKKIKNTDKGIALLVSPTLLPSYDLHLEWINDEGGGNWYECKQLAIVGWLCPALYKYFNPAPEHLYAIIQEIP